jgi:hypothetical protein
VPHLPVNNDPGDQRCGPSTARARRFQCYPSHRVSRQRRLPPQMRTPASLKTCAYK